MTTLAVAGFFIVATSLLTVNAVTFCPFGFSPTNASNGTSSRLSVAGLILSLNRPLQCNGTLVAWQYCYRATNGSAQITFQVWRPNGTSAYTRLHSTSLNKTFSTASGATVCERVVASAQVTVRQSDVIGVLLPFSSANLTVGVLSPNGSVSTLRYIPAISTNNVQLRNNMNVTIAQLSSSLNASLMVYVELLETTSFTVSPSAVKSTTSTGRASTVSVKSTTSTGRASTVSALNRSILPSTKTPAPSPAPSSSSLATYLSSSPVPYVARSDSSAQVVAAASASSIVGVFVVICVVVAVVIAVLWIIRSRKTADVHHPPPPTDNPTYDTADSPRTKYFDASNLVKQISGKSLTTSSKDQSRPTTPGCQTASRYLSLTVIATSEVPEFEKNTYTDPSANIDAILLQLVELNIPLLTKEDITVQSLSRSGQFSALSKAVWKNGDTRYQVAVKSATVQNQAKEHILMLQEAAIMGQLVHPNIVSIYGVVNEKHSAMLVIEHLQQGDLDTFLKTLTPEDCSKAPPPQSTSRLLLGFCQQIALGMHYLSSRDYVHCDLAARSVFVSEDNICKVGEFGMSKRLATLKGRSPVQGRDQVRWMAPETINSNVYTSCSDTWSYGCLLYEIWSLGKMPYEDCTDAEVAEKISSGWRLPPPPGCPRHIYKMMMECWNPEPSSRPSFRDILVSLTQDHSKVMTIPREDARSHPKATTLGGHLHAGQDMYGDLQNSYASGADEIDNRTHPNGAPTWSNGEGIELTHSDEQMEESMRNDSTTDQLCEGMYDRVNEVVGNAEPGELYEGMEGCATEGVYDSASVHEEPTYDVVHDSIHLP